ncbi:MAG TPA: hypothetical protein VGF38_01130 [Ktedonobacterales bacterium]|jgi:hypothetical protein
MATPQQQVEGEGKQPTHTHPPLTHTHDHYHVTHHHSGGVLGVGGWEHRTFWHTHEHSHNELTHSHDYSQEDEGQHHAKEAHNHRHED